MTKSQISLVARGSYQVDILLGREALSGASLRGTARLYGARYARSRRAVCDRLRELGIPAAVTQNKRGKLELVTGERAQALLVCGHRESRTYLGLPLFKVVK